MDILNGGELRIFGDLGSALHWPIMVDVLLITAVTSTMCLVVAWAWRALS